MKDNFSRQVDTYARYRPDYPQELFDFILQPIKNKNAAWDCATGNGQTAKVLANYFKDVFATDISQKQIDNAEKKSNIHYSVQPAEKTGFTDNSFDLVTISQALHWFANDNFYREIKRVARQGGLIAAWSYSLLSISPSIDKLINEFYTKTIGPYWDAERKYVDEEYRSIPFPFREMVAPGFQMEYYWTLEELEGYLNTWSAVQKFIMTNDYNPVNEVIGQVQHYAGSGKMKIIFPLHLRMGIIK